MKYGVSLFPLRPQQLIEVALKAEELGFDSVWLGEHVVTPLVSNSKFPYGGEGANAHDASLANLPFYDPYAALGYLAAITHSIRLAVSVSIVPLHDPFRLARSIATLDLFSNGRLVFGMGSGWLKEEFEVLGRDWTTRGRRFDETLDVLIRLFNEEVTSYQGETLVVPPVGMIPKPQTRPHPPFVFGGHATAALQRAARRGDGWLASELSPSEVATAIYTLRRLREEAGRGASPFEVSCHVPGHIDAELVARYSEAGVDRLVVRPWTKGRDATASLCLLADQVGPLQ
jgi:probable F420-dependent oxidoreductase